jgi:hypothetical protein
VQARGKILQNSALSGSVFGSLVASLASLAFSMSLSLDFQKILQKNRCQCPIRYQAAEVSNIQKAIVLPNKNMLYALYRIISALVGNSKFQPIICIDTYTKVSTQRITS